MSVLLIAKDKRQRNLTPPRQGDGRIGHDIVDAARQTDGHRWRRTVQRPHQTRHARGQFGPCHRTCVITKGQVATTLRGQFGQFFEYQIH